MVSKIIVNDNPNHPLGYRYNVQIWNSVDGGKSFYYCGIGRFCKTMDEVHNYIKTL